MTSTSPAFSASMLRDMVWSVTRVMLAGSMPASRRSCCRQSHGVGTSHTVARRPAAHQQEGIAADHLAEADDVAVRALVIGLVDPHRAAPADVDRVVHQPLGGIARSRRARELDLDCFFVEGAAGKGGVE